MDERERRIGLNEALFREVNEAVSGISEKFHSQTFEIVCECGDTACTDRIELTREEYEAVRSESTQFVDQARPRDTRRRNDGRQARPTTSSS